MKESNKTYAVNVLNYIRESKSIDNDLLEEGVARLFSNDNQSFEDNLELILNWLYAGGNDRTNVHTLVAELSGELKSSTILDNSGELGYSVKTPNPLYHASGTLTTIRHEYR